MLKVRPVFFGGSARTKRDINDDKLLSKIPKVLPRPEFRLMLVGPSGCGKSMTAKWLLTEQYDGIFDRIVVFCPTIENDKTLSDLVNFKKPKDSILDVDYVFTDTDKDSVNDTLETLWKKFMKEDLDSKDEPYHVLFIFDDVGGEYGRNKAVENLFTKGRKMKASIMVMSNAYRTYGPTIRSNTTHYCIFKPGTVQEKDAIINDIEDTRGKNYYYDLFETTFSAPKFKQGDFIFVNKDKIGEKDYVRTNFG